MSIENWISNQIENELFNGIPSNVNSSFKADHIKMKRVRLPCIPYLIGLYGLLVGVVILKKIMHRSINYDV